MQGSLLPSSLARAQSPFHAGCASPRRVAHARAQVSPNPFDVQGYSYSGFARCTTGSPFAGAAYANEMSFGGLGTSVPPSVTKLNFNFWAVRETRAFANLLSLTR